MDRKQQNILWLVIGIVVFAGVIGLAVYKKNAPGKYDTFVSCIKDSGTIFYGAFWCPHCQEQKALFGNSAKLLPYTECSTPSKAQTQVCTDAGVTSYPTWKFPDGTLETGLKTIVELAEKTKCVLPQ